MILIDTNIVISYYNVRDSCHLQALELIRKINENFYGTAFITDYVFDEAVTVCANRVGKKAAIELGNALGQAFVMIKISELIFKRAWALFKQPHKLSFTDCANIAAAQELSIDFVATFDQEYKKMQVKIVP